MSAPPAPPGDETPHVPEALKRPAIPKAIVVVALTLIVLLLGAVATLRYGVLLPQARILIEARTDGLRIGRVGRLRIEGLSGDIWRDARVRRLTIRDEKGVWLEAINVHLSWRYVELLRRRFDADLIEADSVRIVRRPTLAPKGKDRGLPVSFHIDEARTRLTLEPAFSYARGVYDVRLGLDIERLGGRSGCRRTSPSSWTYAPTGPPRRAASPPRPRPGPLRPWSRVEPGTRGAGRPAGACCSPPPR